MNVLKTQLVELTAHNANVDEQLKLAVTAAFADNAAQKYNSQGYEGMKRINNAVVDYDIDGCRVQYKGDYIGGTGAQGYGTFEWYDSSGNIIHTVNSTFDKGVCNIKTTLSGIKYDNTLSMVNSVSTTNNTSNAYIIIDMQKKDVTVEHIDNETKIQYVGTFDSKQRLIRGTIIFVEGSNPTSMLGPHCATTTMLDGLWLHVN